LVILPPSTSGPSRLKTMRFYNSRNAGCQTTRHIFINEGTLLRENFRG
jgi:hypothetical protein